MSIPHTILLACGLLVWDPLRWMHGVIRSWWEDRFQKNSNQTLDITNACGRDRKKPPDLVTIKGLFQLQMEGGVFEIRNKIAARKDPHPYTYSGLPVIGEKISRITGGTRSAGVYFCLRAES